MGMKWNVVFVVMIDSLERFREEVKGLFFLYVKFMIKQILFLILNEGGIVGEYCQKLVNEIGVDIDVDVKIFILNDFVFLMLRKRFKLLVFDFVLFVVGQGKKMSVSGVDFVDKLFEFNFVEYLVMEQEEIVILKGEMYQFMNFIKYFVIVCEQ